tara:strand:+ start:134 stop:475 length:342 start_codon:yes stop_codon:yes gene_type:complete
MLLHNNPYKIFEDLFFADQNTSFYPFQQKDNAFEAVLEVPGFSKDNLKIEVEETHVKLSGEAEVGGKTRTLSKSYELPQKADSKKLSAKLNNGILELLVPRKDRSKKIPISIK